MMIFQGHETMLNMPKCAAKACSMMLCSTVKTRQNSAAIIFRELSCGIVALNVDTTDQSWNL